MRPSNLVFAAVGLLSPIATSALELNVDDPGAHTDCVFGLY
jgi:mannan endo-1,6-alpha-mannosidase